MKNTNWKEAIWSACKEFGRTAILAILAVVVPILIAQLQGNGMVDWRAVLVAAAIALLRALDKFVQKWNGTSMTGLVPF